MCHEWVVWCCHELASCLAAETFMKQILYSVIQLFFDSESDSVVIGLEDCPVLSGDVKVRFESTSVSTPAWRLSLECGERLQCKLQWVLPGWAVWDRICSSPVTPAVSHCAVRDAASGETPAWASRGSTWLFIQQYYQGTFSWLPAAPDHGDLTSLCWVTWYWNNCRENSDLCVILGSSSALILAL